GRRTPPAGGTLAGPPPHSRVRAPVVRGPPATGRSAPVGDGSTSPPNPPRRSVARHTHSSERSARLDTSWLPRPHSACDRRPSSEDSDAVQRCLRHRRFVTQAVLPTSIRIYPLTSFQGTQTSRP